jgi:carbon storage regulator
MLVLSRRDGEQIIFGNDVVVKVLSIDGGRVRIGIDAPREVAIRRGELAEFDRPERFRSKQYSVALTS